MQNIIIRGVATIAIGILIIAMREVFMPFLVQCIGILFVLPALFAIVAFVYGFFKQNVKSPAWMLGLSGIGSMAFGIWLILRPDFFIGFFMYVLGGLLLLLGIYQICAFALARRKMPLSIYMMFVPILLVCVGLIVLIKPFGVASLPFFLLGVTIVIGGLSDIINNIIIKQKRAKKDNDIIEIESV